MEIGFDPVIFTQRTYLRTSLTIHSIFYHFLILNQPTNSKYTFYLSLFLCFNYQLTALYYYYYYQLESFGSSFWIILFMFLNHSNTLHTLNLHFPSFLNTFSILIQILQRFNHSTSLQFHPSIHLPNQTPQPFLSLFLSATAKSVWIVETWKHRDPRRTRRDRRGGRG